MVSMRTSVRANSSACGDNAVGVKSITGFSRISPHDAGWQRGLDCWIQRPTPLPMNILDSVVTQAAAIAAIRRDIHAHPELCFEEVRTADVVAQKLTEWDIPIHRGLG